MEELQQVEEELRQIDQQIIYLTDRRNQLIQRQDDLNLKILQQSKLSGKK